MRFPSPCFLPAVLPVLLLGLTGCAPPDCPTDVALAQADLSCSCGGQVLDSLTCDTTICTTDGVILGDGTCQSL